MITVELDNFSLREICRSGQCFRMHETAENNTYELVAGDKYLKISQAGSIVNFYCSDVEFICYWVPYFDIDSDYGRYIEKVNPRDTYLSAAVQCGNGIRILRQDLWEMIITFLISQQNNISRIRSCIERLCVRYGEKLKAGDTEYYSFPTPQQLSGATEEELRRLGMGYRARYIVETTRSILEGEVSLEKLYQMKYYRRIYQARMVEQRRFDKHSAYLAKELERMNQLQEQYLFLVDNNIKTVEGLVTYQVLGERDVEKISERQQDLYQQNRARKRACKTEEDIRDYQIWHMGA